MGLFPSQAAARSLIVKNKQMARTTIFRATAMLDETESNEPKQPQLSAGVVSRTTVKAMSETAESTSAAARVNAKHIAIPSVASNNTK